MHSSVAWHRLDPHDRPPGAADVPLVGLGSLGDEEVARAPYVHRRRQHDTHGFRAFKLLLAGVHRPPPPRRHPIERRSEGLAGGRLESGGVLSRAGLDRWSTVREARVVGQGWSPCERREARVVAQG